MPYSILLPANARSLSFIPTSLSYNSNYDITWSFNYTVSGDYSPINQYGICTFLTLLSASETGVLSGHFLNTKPTTSSPISAQVLSGDTVYTLAPYNLISIAFDSTGLFALSTSATTGIPVSAILENRLIVRNIKNDVIYNASLSSINSAFSGTNYIRCNYSNSQKTIFIDYRNNESVNYTNIATIPLNYKILNELNTNNTHVGFTFCSPISTASTYAAPTVLLTNFHTDGVVS